MPGEVRITPSTAGLPEGLTREAWREQVERAAAAWNAAVPAGCELELTVAALSSAWLAEEDGVNLVVIRDRSFCHNERCGKVGTYPLRALGMTTVYPEGARLGAVREGDVELHGRLMAKLGDGATSEGDAAASGPWGFRFAGQDGPSLQAVLVHELGHVIGLPDLGGATHGGEDDDSGPSNASLCEDSCVASVHSAARSSTGPSSRAATNAWNCSASTPTALASFARCSSVRRCFTRALGSATSMASRRPARQRAAPRFRR